MNATRFALTRLESSRNPFLILAILLAFESDRLFEKCPTSDWVFLLSLVKLTKNLLAVHTLHTVTLLIEPLDELGGSGFGRRYLLQHLGDETRGHSPYRRRISRTRKEQISKNLLSALTNIESLTRFHTDRMQQLTLHLDIITRHDHLIRVLYTLRPG